MPQISKHENKFSDHISENKVTNQTFKDLNKVLDSNFKDKL